VSERRRRGLGGLASRIGGALDEAILATLSGRFATRRSHSRSDQAAHAPDRRALLAEAIAFYSQPHILSGERFFVAPPAPRVIEEPRGKLPHEGSIVDLKWASEFEPSWAEVRKDYLAHEANRFAYARLYRHARPAPSIICLHGYRSGSFFVEERAFVARWLYSLGLNVALLQLPFHGKRGGDRAPVWPSINVARTNEGFAHAVFDLRALASWLRARTDGAELAMTGMSLGGYTTALFATVEPLAFAAPMIPVASFPDLLWDHGEGRPERARAEREGITREMLRAAMAVHTPLERAPMLAPERVLVISAEGDRIAPPAHAARLAAHFRCEERSFVGGHVLQLGRGDAFRALAKRLAALSIIPARG